MVTAVSKHTAKATTKNKKNEKIIHQGYIGRFWLWCLVFSFFSHKKVSPKQNKNLPIVHKHIWFPQSMGWDP